jgi:hypothetical protein
MGLTIDDDALSAAISFTIVVPPGLAIKRVDADALQRMDAG